MAETEQTHRHAMDNDLVESDKREDRRLSRGQWLGAAVVACCCIVAIVAIIAGYPTVAGIVMGTTIVALAGVFVVGRLTSE